MKAGFLSTPAQCNGFAPKGFDEKKKNLGNHFFIDGIASLSAEKKEECNDELAEIIAEVAKRACDHLLDLDARAIHKYSLRITKTDPGGFVFDGLTRIISGESRTHRILYM